MGQVALNESMLVSAQHHQQHLLHTTEEGIHSDNLMNQSIGGDEFNGYRGAHRKGHWELQCSRDIHCGHVAGALHY